MFFGVVGWFWRCPDSRAVAGGVVVRVGVGRCFFSEVGGVVGRVFGADVWFFIRALSSAAWFG